MVFSILQKSQLEGAKRLDAEYYQPEYLGLNSQLTRQKSTPLDELAEIVCGPFGSAILNQDYRSEGVPLIRVADLNSWFVNDDDLTFIEDELSGKFKRYQVTDRDLVVSQRGTIAMFSKVTNKFLKWNISANLISIKNSGKINFDYLLIFLNSRYGIKQLLRKLSGQVQPKITTDDVKNILVPVPEESAQSLIAKFVNDAWQEQERSRQYYQQAEALLLEEFGLKGFEKNGDGLFSIVNLSDIKEANRCDAEYFQSKYKKLIARINSQKVALLEDIIENVPAKYNPAGYPEKIFRYVELANINSTVGMIDGFSEVQGREAPSRAKRILKPGDVIVSSVEGSLDKVALVEKEQENYLASTGFFQLRSRKILPEVVLVLANSLVLQMQLEKQCAGTILAAVPKEAIKNVVIPILPSATQNKIADLVIKSHEARKKAKELLEEAKLKVEEMIEKSN